jgi:hypothetical protein
VARLRRSRGAVIRQVLVAAGSSVVLALLAGCSGATPDGTSERAGTRSTSGPAPTREAFYGMSNTKVLAKVRTDVAAATNVHVTGWHVNGTKRTRYVNLRMNRAGRCFGTVVTDEATVRLRRRGPVLYLKAGRAHWQGYGEAIATRLAGRWIKTRKGFSKEFDLYFAMTRPEYWLKEWTGPDGAEDLTRETGILLDGVQTTALSEGAATVDVTGALFIASSGPALPQQVRFAAPDQDLITFRTWNTTAVPVHAPTDPLDPGAAGL